VIANFQLSIATSEKLWFVFKLEIGNEKDRQ